MKVSLLGATNLEKFALILGKDQPSIIQVAKEIGKTLVEQDCELQVVFNNVGMLKLVADAYKEAGGKLTMLYTENDYDWETKPYMNDLKKADSTVKLDSWHDMLLHLVSEADVVLCAGLSAGVFAELAYIKWNHQENKCRIKALIGVKELLRDGKFPPEIEYDINDKIVYAGVKELAKKLKELK